MINQRAIRNLRVSTLAELIAIPNGNNNTITYCDETKSHYFFLEDGGAFEIDNDVILPTGAGGNTRWSRSGAGSSISSHSNKRGIDAGENVSVLEGYFAVICPHYYVDGDLIADGDVLEV